MNLLKSAGQALAAFAPTVATALGGPLVGVAVSTVEKAFGIDSASSPEAKEAAINAGLVAATPDQIVALKAGEQAFIAKMKELGITEEQLTFTDLDSARKMQIAVRDPTVARLAWILIGGFLVTAITQIAGMILLPEKMAAVPSPVWLQIGTISGYLANEAKQAAAFYFGSSAGSQAKDATISDMAKQS